MNLLPDLKNLGLPKEKGIDQGLNARFSSKSQASDGSSFDQTLKQKLREPQERTNAKPIEAKRTEPNAKTEVSAKVEKMPEEKNQENEKVERQPEPKASRAEPNQTAKPQKVDAKMVNEHLDKLNAQLQKVEAKLVDQLEELGEKIDPEDLEKMVSELTDVKSVGDKAGVNLEETQRQQVMQNFMDSLESELGIPPERIVEAMAKLPTKELLSPPEETATDVIKNLELDPKDQEKAEALYVGMVMQLQQLQTAPVLHVKANADPESSTKARLAAVMGALGLEGQQLSQVKNAGEGATEGKVATKSSVENILQKSDKPGIDLNDKALVKQSKISDYAYNQKEFQPKAEHGQTLKPESTDAPKVAPNATVADAQKALPVVAGDPRLQNSMVDNKQSNNDKVSAKDDGDESIEQRANKEIVGASAAAGAKTHQLSESSAKDGQSGQGHSHSEHKSDAKTQGDVVSKLASGEKTAADFNLGHNQVKSDNVNKAVAGGSVGSTADILANKEDHAGNIQQLMNQAQYLIKKGGGESTVRMTPEGMGQVHLRVSVSDGKVSLQMATENKDTKKLIESSIGDLKTSLNAHKLSVDHIKVDVGHQLASNMDKQPDQQADKGSRHMAQGDMSRNPAKHQAAMGSSKDEQNARNAFKDFDFANKPKTSTMTSQATAKSRYLGAGKGSGLDLVA